MKTYFNKTNTNLGLLILRLGLGIQFILHGWPKISGGADKWAKLGESMSIVGIDFAHSFWGFMAAFAEFGGGVLLLIGLFVRPASALMAFTMLIASARHWHDSMNDPEVHSAKDIWMSGSHALELCVVLLALYFLGSDKYSLDKKLFAQTPGKQ